MGSLFVSICMIDNGKSDEGESSFYKKSYLDRGFDLSELEASLPLLLLHDGINDDVVLSLPNDGLDTRFLPIYEKNKFEKGFDIFIISREFQKILM